MKSMRTISMFSIALLSGCLGNSQKVEAPPTGQKQVVAAITEIGGTLKYQDGDPNKPVIEVNFRNNPKVTEGILKQLHKLKYVEKLDLTRTNISDADLAHLHDMTELQTLWLSYTQIGDDGVKHLKGITNLKWLDLVGTKITDAGVTHLTELTKLEYLELQATSVTAEGAKKLKAALPGVSIVK